MLLLLLDQGGGAGEVAAVPDPRGSPIPLASLPGGIDGIAALVAADLDGAGAPEGERCDEVALARAGGTRIQLYRLCDPDGSLTFAPLAAPEVELDGGAALRDRNGSLALVDYNADGQVDLLTNADDGALHIAYGLGDGRFHSLPPPAAAPDQRTSALAVPDPMLGEQLVNPDALFVAGEFDAAQPGAELRAVPCPPDAAPFESPACAPVEGPCEAVVADVDADGHLDVVATDGQQPDLVLRRGLEGGGFHVGFLETQCPPRQLAVGDVDGDGVPDIAFFDQVASPPEGSAEDPPPPATALTVAYGAAFAAPAPPWAQSRFDQALGLVAGRFIEGPPGDQLYAARGLAGVQGASSALALVGQSERLLLAPFYFPAPPGPPMGGTQPLVLQVSLRATAAGRFGTGEGGEPRPGVAVITQDLDPMTHAPRPGTEKLWLIDGDVSAGSLTALYQSAVACDDCVLVALPAAGGGHDGALLLGDGEVVVYEVGAEGFAERGSLATAHAFRSLDRALNPAKYVPRPLVADLDRDGHEDVVARSSEGALVAFWGREDGGFDETVLADPPACEGGAACGGLSIASLNADADAAREIAVVGPGELEVFDLDAAARALVPIHAELSIPEPPLSTDFTAIGAADVDGDGVDDLVVMTSSSFFHVLRGLPVSE
jgi:hypothetical protein